MATRNVKKRPSDSHEPKAVGEILDEMPRSDSRFATAYRRYMEAVDAEAEVETGQLFRDLFADTHLCVNLELLTREPGLIPVGAYLDGIITRNGEDTFLFAEKAKEKKVKTVQRNPIIFAGSCVNVHLLADGTKRLEFNRPRFYSDFTFRDFCVAAAQELLTIARLLGEDNSEE